MKQTKQVASYYLNKENCLKKADDCSKQKNKDFYLMLANFYDELISLDSLSSSIKEHNDES